MERVQFQQEQMLAELKDLVEKGVFTTKETKVIMKKRTAFETALVRRVAKKTDYLHYAAYEMGLEQLRRKRVERLEIPTTPTTISDYALVRRQFQIFERALKKFPSDIGLWVQYIKLAKREGARALVGRICARAIHLHPTTPSLYILAASHELDHLSPSTARALLQRGLRLNGDTVEMWREYVRMEMGFIESLRRRWEVLGIGNDSGRTGKASLKVANNSPEADADIANVEPEQTVLELEEDGSSDARKEIMEGAIVKSVITNAARALPTVKLFTSLLSLIETYPCPASLRDSLLEHLYAVLKETLPWDRGALKLRVRRFLGVTEQDDDGEQQPVDDADIGVEDGSRDDRKGQVKLTVGNVPEGEALVGGIQKANEELISVCAMVQEMDDGGGKAAADVYQVYGSFIEEWCSKDIDGNLKLYLICSLRSLIDQQKISSESGTPSPLLLAAHLRILVNLAKAASCKGGEESVHGEAKVNDGTLAMGVNGKVNGELRRMGDPAKVVRTARKYTKLASGNVGVWFARMEAEIMVSDEDRLDTLWQEAEGSVGQKLSRVLGS